MPTIFTKIINREIPADIVSRSGAAFRDINAQAPTHVLVIPKEEIASLDDISDDNAHVMGHLFFGGPQGRRLRVTGGYRTVINCARRANSGPIHIHLLGGRALSWPPGRVLSETGVFPFASAQRRCVVAE